MRQFFKISLAGLSCAACASLGDPDAARGIAAGSLPPVSERWTEENARAGDVQIGWIDAMDDPALSRLVEEAIANNNDLRVAAGVVAEARALAKQAGAAIVPAIDITASGARGGVLRAPSADSYSLGGQLNWEVDVWGRVRANKRAAALGAYSAEADYQFTQYSIAAAVAQSYFLTIEAGLQLEVARKSLAALTETDRIVNAQRDIGVATGLDVALSKRDLANARDNVFSAEASRRLAVRALEVLLGRYPSALLEARSTLPQTPPSPPAGLPSSLLSRRPDIIAAELSVAAAANSVSAAQAARLPTISLTSTIGGSSTELSDVLDPENVAWQVAGNLLGPLFDGGLRKGAVDEARGAEERAIGAYAQTVLAAFEEVETSLDQNIVLRNREATLREAALQANRAFELAQIRYEEGETDLLDVLTIQSTAFTADSALVSVQRALLEEWIALNLALGGDWRAP